MIGHWETGDKGPREIKGKSQIFLSLPRILCLT